MATARVIYTPERIIGAGGDLVPGPGTKLGTASTPLKDDVVWAIVAVTSVVVAAFIADWVAPDDSFPPATLPTVAEGLTIFATFYVVAQAVERLLEPFSRVLLTSDKAEKDSAEKGVDAQNAVTAGDPNAAESVKEAAKAKAALAARDQHRTILFWAIASVVGVAVSAGMKLYFLQRVGIQNSSRWWEVLATGLIIGAGTKPLHDLIELISSKKNEAAGATSEASTSP